MGEICKSVVLACPYKQENFAEGFNIWILRVCTLLCCLSQWAKCSQHSTGPNTAAFIIECLSCKDSSSSGLSILLLLCRYETLHSLTVDRLLGCTTGGLYVIWSEWKNVSKNRIKGYFLFATHIALCFIIKLGGGGRLLVGHRVSRNTAGGDAADGPLCNWWSTTAAAGSLHCGGWILSIDKTNEKMKCLTQAKEVKQTLTPLILHTQIGNYYNYMVS
jgi:hypothetical protein